MGNKRDYNKLAVTALLMILLTSCGSAGTIADNGYDLESGVELTSEYSSPEELSVGDIMYVNFGTSEQTTLDFSKVESDAKFILVVGSVNEGGTGTYLQLSGDISAAIEKEISQMYVDEDLDYTAEEILSAWLRSAEYELAATESIPDNYYGGMKAMGIKSVSVGQVEQFRVLSSLSSTNLYTNIDASVRCVGNDVIVYVDVETSPNNLDDGDITYLCDIYDNIAREEQDLLGDSSDVNGDGMVSVLMTPQINRLGSMGGGIITGYFWAGDLYERSSSNVVSNHREIIYTMVPDPAGIYGTVISKDFAMENLLTAIFPHEFQHAISYNKHVFENGAPPEQNWLNEGLSHFSEDLFGYGMENPSRYALFLESTATTGLVVGGQPDLMERGAAYLFVRYLYEQTSSPEDFLRDIEDTSRIGVDNIEAAFNGPSGFSKFHELMARWTVALAMTGKGISQDSRYTYNNRVMNNETGHWEGACLYGDADDGRGTVLQGVNMTSYKSGQSAQVVASAAKFYDIQSVPGAIHVEGSTGGGNFGVLIRQQ